MKKSIGKLGTILIIIATIILAGIAIFTAYRLYQLRQQSVAPNAPSSIPKAATPGRGLHYRYETVSGWPTNSASLSQLRSTLPRILPSRFYY
jgi:hypothetical protein